MPDENANALMKTVSSNPVRLLIATVLGLRLCAAATAATDGSAGLAAAPHNVVIFVADGLRASIVDGTTAPAIDAVGRTGVRFTNTHSVFPTFTTANASALATGHYLGDTGDFSNTIYAGFAVPSAKLSVTPFLESDPVLGDLDEKYDGNYLNEETLLALARRQGYGTAAIGKLGPTSIQDVTSRDGASTIILDDSTGHIDAAGKPEGLPISAAVQADLTSRVGTAIAPSRGANGMAGDATVPGTATANVVQQKWFVDAATRVVLPRLAAQKRPFVLVFWSRDPDGSQHNQGDSLGNVVPGINGPTSIAAIHNADDNLSALREALRELGLAATTDVIVTADHGFSTISKESRTSPAAGYALTGVPAHALPPGFLALDLGHALGLPVSDPDRDNAVVHPDLEKRYPTRGNGLIGMDASAPDVIVAANGGSDLIYLPQRSAATMLPRVLTALMEQDYVSGLFVDDALGAFPGTLPLSSIYLRGSALTPTPSIVVSFRSYSAGCSLPQRCAVEIADSTFQQGQGMHGSFSRADTAIYAAAVGPDFKPGFGDPAPMSNADIPLTVASILNLPMPSRGKLVGRVLREAFPGEPVPRFERGSLVSAPAQNNLATILRYQQLGAYRYFDVAGFANRTVGL